MIYEKTRTLSNFSSTPEDPYRIITIEKDGKQVNVSGGFVLFPFKEPQAFEALRVFCSLLSNGDERKVPLMEMLNRAGRVWDGDKSKQ